MIAKLIAHGKDRQDAIKIMQRALDEFIISPVKTTIPFHQTVFNNPQFLRGTYYTNFVETMMKEKE